LRTSAEWCELYLAGTAEAPVFMRSRVDGASGKAFMGLGARQAIAGMRDQLGIVAHTIDDLASGECARYARVS